MPAVPVSLCAPIWDQFRVLLPERPAVVPTHPLGFHRRRVPDEVVFRQIVAALVHGSGYKRIAAPGCSDRTIRRRLNEWAALGLAGTLHTLVLDPDDRLIGVEVDEIAADGCITNAPSSGERAGRSPVDRGKQGLKRATAAEATGVPLFGVAAGANRHDSPLWEPTLAGVAARGLLEPGATVHLDRGYDSAATRTLLGRFGLQGVIARKGVPAPLQASTRWVVERTQSWMNGYGKLRRCTDRRGPIVSFYRFLAAALVVTRMLIDRARTRYRWPSQPTTRRPR